MNTSTPQKPWTTDYGHMMTRFQILYSPNPYLNPKYVENPVKCMKILALL